MPLRELLHSFSSILFLHAIFAHYVFYTKILNPILTFIINH